MKYRKKPVVIEASQWRMNGDHPAVRRYAVQPGDPMDCSKCHKPYDEHGVIRTLEDTDAGAHIVCPLDWIITGVKGENYACKPDIFAATYDPADTRPEVVAKMHPALLVWPTWPAPSEEDRRGDWLIDPKFLRNIEQDLLDFYDYTADEETIECVLRAVSQRLPQEVPSTPSPQLLSTEKKNG